MRIEIKSPVGESRNDYVYRSDGTKMRVVHKWNPAYSTAPVIGSSVSESALTESETTDYVGNFVYRNGSLKQVLTETGYIENGLYYDYIKDHLGSNRLVVHDSPSSQAINYYPFGLPQSDEKAPEIQDYKFIGKEYDSKQGLRLYDFEARMYDPQLGRFLTMDALSEKYYSWSPYNYAFCNPTRFIDPTGMSPEDDEWEKRLRYRSLLDRLAAGLRSLFTIEIDTRTSESLSASAARHEEKIQTLGNAVETVNTATDALSAVMPFGSTILSVAKAASGEDVNAGDVGFAAMEIVPLGAVGKVAKGGKIYTKSNLKLGQQMHKVYKVGLNDGINGIKEFRLPSGKRIDFLDIQNKTIYELKPFNPRSIRQGQKQLNIYMQELQTLPRFKGFQWTIKLDTY